METLVKRREELQMQILYIIGCAVERHSPRAYFNYDGGNGCLRFTSIHDFPQSTVGYTVSCWVKLTNVQGSHSVCCVSLIKKKSTDGSVL